jgi:16S rRNA processing protein RimM
VPAGDAEDTGGWVTVGRIGPARGVRGDLFVEPFTEDPEGRFAVGAVLATDPPDAGPLTVEKLDLHGARMVLHFVEAADRPAAEALRGVRLVMPAGERPPIDDPDEFYASDLVGLAARRPDGTPIGPIVEVVDIAGADYLVLNVAGAEKLVPFVSDVVPTVDITAGYVVVDPPEGLFEI